MKAPALARERPPGGGGLLRRVARDRLAYLFLAPALLLVLLVTIYPLAQALVTSLYDTQFLARTGFAGIGHYRALLADPEGRASIRRSFEYVFGSLALALPLGLLLAVVLNRPLRFRTLFRTIAVLPWIVSQLVVALMWGWVINPQYGPVNYWVQLWLGSPVDLLGQPPTAMPTLILVNVWRSFPYPMLLILAALQGVPGELLEAATVDGASRRVRFWRVVFPMIRNTVLVATIMLGVHYFNMITLPFVLTGGGPLGATDVMSLRVYREAFQFHHVGFASAIAVYMFAFNVLFSLVYIRVLRTEGAY